MEVMASHAVVSKVIIHIFTMSTSESHIFFSLQVFSISAGVVLKANLSEDNATVSCALLG